MKKEGQQPKKPRPGRPWKNTPGSKPRTFRVTDEEYEQLFVYLGKLRNKPRKESSK